MYRPFIEDPRHRRLLDGQRYVVLRANAAVRVAYLDTQRLVREKLGGLDASYPAEPHATLLGLGAGTDLEAVRGLVADWAREVPPLRLEIERLGVFPPPFQIVIVQIRKTPDLLEALSSLRERAQHRGLADASRIAPGDWIFHLSIAYCPLLDAASWSAAERFVHGLATPQAQEVASEAEIAAYDDMQESSGGCVPLGGLAHGATAGRADGERH